MYMKKGTPITKEYLEEYLDPKFKQIDDRFKYIESNFVTKDYFSKEVSSIRSMLHESITVSMANMKEYYKEETERYIGVLMESYRNESVVMKENVSILNDKFYDYEERITTLETATAP